MTLPEPLDEETTAPDLPDGYDPDGGWTAQEWLDALWWDALRPADFDDEETRP